VIDWLPKAFRNQKGRALAWTQKTDPKGCLHTTESSDWPTYTNWTVQPHATVKPHPGQGVEIRQHVPFTHASFSLKNLPGGVQTNTDFVFQFELIGTSERGGPGLYWPDADGVVLLALYDDLIQPLSTAFNIPLIAPVFQPYPASYGPKGKTNTVRFTGAHFDTYSGWLGHQHIPENVHGDPGAFPWARMLALVAARKRAQEKDLDVDEKTLRAIIRSEVLDIITNSAIVPNKPTVAGLKADAAAPTTMFTLPAVLANIETDQDNDRDSLLKAILARQDAIVTALGTMGVPLHLPKEKN
jgi:hypothetical protein